MYKREIKKAPKKIIKHGKPIFGTFSTLPEKLDISGVKAPFLGIPVPPILTRFAIRSRLIYTFSFEDYLGSIDLFDSKIVNMAEISLWNKKTNLKYVYRIFLGLRLHLIPKKLHKAVCVSTAKTRYIRIGWDHDRDRLSIKFKVKGDNVRPYVELAFLGKLNSDTSKEIFSVKPAPTMSRCSATWYSFSPIIGRMKFTHKSGDILENYLQKSGYGFLFENRSYYKYITSGENLTACGKINEKDIGFRLSTTSLDGVNTDEYNDNILFIDGKITTMPPVQITHPFGINQNWIIQDFESMVDLTFTPKNTISRSLNFIAIKSTYHTVFGTIEGVLLDSEGNKIILKDFPAIVKKSKLRI